VVAVPYSDFDEEDELVSGTNANVTRTPSTNGNGNGHGGKREGMGALLDKKTSEAINLVGRRDGTVGVLTPELVALVSLGIRASSPWHARVLLPLAPFHRRYEPLLRYTYTCLAQIHSHLPALLRLPRQWTLFYSLDQHGISLNTLYSRCAPPSSSRPPHPKGALLVIQDAVGVLFGAWIADGLKRSTRGGYYGGGESCVSFWYPR
jgi:hypothetical protein